MKRIICATVLMASSAACWADWPQWRGPDRNGIAPQSPPLLDEFPKEGPKKLWESEGIPGAYEGGWGSVAVVGGKAYVFANPVAPATWRMISIAVLRERGYCPEMPAELSKKVEEARTSDERKALKDAAAVTAWMDEWIKANTAGDLSKYAPNVRLRLIQGPNGITREALEKLATIADKKFDTDADWVAWLKDSGLDAATQRIAQPFASHSAKAANDHLYCLDAATGKTLWKQTFGADWFACPDSCTPTVVDGKVLVLSSTGAICCFNAADGTPLWQSPVITNVGKQHHARSSNVLVTDGLAIATGEPAISAVSMADQKVVWKAERLGFEFSSGGVAWPSGGKNYLLQVAGGKMNLIDLKDGKVLGADVGGRYSSPTFAGEYAVGPGSDRDGLSGYKIAPDKVTRIWTYKGLTDEYASALIDGGFVYALGGGFAEGKAEHKGKALCLELKSAKVMWEESLPMAQLSTPLLADGKVFAVVGSELVVFKANSEKFQLVGRAELGLEKWCSPALADGRLFLRTPKNVVCYDVRKAP